MRHEHSDVTIPDNSNKLRCSPSTEQNFVVCNSVSFKMFEQEVSWPADFAKQGETRVSAL